MDVKLNNIWEGELTFHLPGGPVSFKNTLTYGGVDVLVRALAGTTDAALTHLYLRFGSDLPVAIAEATAANFRHTGSGGTYGALYIPLFEPPALSTSSSGFYKNNVLTFRYVLSGSDLNGSGASSFRSNSYTAGTLFAAGIVSAENYSDRSLDRVVAAIDISAEMLSIADATQVPCTYKLTLTI